MSAPGAAPVPKIAVLGASGFLGRALAAALARAHPDAARLSRADGFDLARPRALDCEALAATGHRAACLCGAVTGVAACEADPAGSARLNVDGTLAVARRLAEAGILPIWFSSDYVFDGRQGGYPDEAIVHPVNEYGRQKAAVEARLPEAAGGRCLILRLSKLYSTTPGDGSLLADMAGRLAAGRQVRAAHDQVFSPTHVDDAARAVLELAGAVLDAPGRAGLAGPEPLNLAAPAAWSRLEIARRLARALGADEALARPIALAELGEPFARPLRTDLRCRRLRRLEQASGLAFSLQFRSLDEALESLARAFPRRAGSGRQS